MSLPNSKMGNTGSRSTSDSSPSGRPRHQATFPGRHATSTHGEGGSSAPCSKMRSPLKRRADDATHVQGPPRKVSSKISGEVRPPHKSARPEKQESKRPQPQQAIFDAGELSDEIVVNHGPPSNRPKASQASPPPPASLKRSVSGLHTRESSAGSIADDAVLADVGAAIKKSPHAYIPSSRLTPSAKNLKRLRRWAAEFEPLASHCATDGYYIVFEDNTSGRRSLAKCCQKRALLGKYDVQPEPRNGDPGKTTPEESRLANIKSHSAIEPGVPRAALQKPQEVEPARPSSSGGVTSASEMSHPKRGKCHRCSTAPAGQPLYECSTCPRRYHASCHQKPYKPSVLGVQNGWQCSWCIRKGIQPLPRGEKPKQLVKGGESVIDKDSSGTSDKRDQGDTRDTTARPRPVSSAIQETVKDASTNVMESSAVQNLITATLLSGGQTQDTAKDTISAPRSKALDAIHRTLDRRNSSEILAQQRPSTATKEMLWRSNSTTKPDLVRSDRATPTDETPTPIPAPSRDVVMHTESAQPRANSGLSDNGAKSSDNGIQPTAQTVLTVVKPQVRDTGHRENHDASLALTSNMTARPAELDIAQSHKEPHGSGKMSPEELGKAWARALLYSSETGRIDRLLGSNIKSGQLGTANSSDRPAGSTGQTLDSIIGFRPTTVPEMSQSANPTLVEDLAIPAAQESSEKTAEINARRPTSPVPIEIESGIARLSDKSGQPGVVSERADSTTALGQKQDAVQRVVEDTLAHSIPGSPSSHESHTAEGADDPMPQARPTAKRTKSKPKIVHCLDCKKKTVQDSEQTSLCARCKSRRNVATDDMERTAHVPAPLTDSVSDVGKTDHDQSHDPDPTVWQINANPQTDVHMPEVEVEDQQKPAADATKRSTSQAPEGASLGTTDPAAEEPVEIPQETPSQTPAKPNKTESGYKEGVDPRTREPVKKRRVMKIGGENLGDSFKRPKGTYEILIGLAMSTTPDHRMQARGVCSWIASNIDQYQQGVDQWESGIGATLSIHEGKKSKQLWDKVDWVEGESDEFGRGCWYTLKPGIAETLARWDPVNKVAIYPPGKSPAHDPSVEKASTGTTPRRKPRKLVADESKPAAPADQATIKPPPSLEGTPTKVASKNVLKATTQAKSHSSSTKISSVAPAAVLGRGLASGHHRITGPMKAEPWPPAPLFFSALKREVDESSIMQRLQHERAQVSYTVKSLCDEWPQLDPEQSFDTAAKIAEIKQRPSRKQMFRKGPMHSRVDHVRLQEDWSDMQGTGAERSFSGEGEKQHSRRGAHIFPYDENVRSFASAKEFLGLPFDPVPVLRNGSLAYRDGTRDLYGNLVRARNVYPAGL